MDFVLYTMPEYEVNWHHRLLCKYLQAFAEGTIKKMMVFMPPQHGKLLPANTPILTTKGWKNHGELNVGDYVFGDDGKPKAVLGNSGVYDWNVERITFDTGITILAAKEHLWKVTINHRDVKIIDTQTIVSLIKRGVRVVLNCPYRLREFRKNHLGFKAYSPFGVKSVATNGITKGNCIQVEGGMYLAGRDLIPTHNSELTSRRLAAYIHGRNPNKLIALSSFSASWANRLNKDIQAIIDSELYHDLFPNTILPKGAFFKGSTSKEKRANYYELINYKGSLKSVGVAGPLTGSPVDVGLIDDPVKDAIEAKSPTYRERAWQWYTQVFMTRLHNESQQLLTMTRWHEDDLAGRILATEDDWFVLSLPAIKEGHTVVEDKRAKGEALWEGKHSKERLLKAKKANAHAFHSLYQQNPQPFKGGLIYSEWHYIEDEGYRDLTLNKAYGLDFGWTSPSACVEVKLDYINKKLYLHQKFYASKHTSSMLTKALEEKGLHKGSIIIADSAKPDSINELQSSFLVSPCKKGPGSILSGITLVNEYEIYITRSSTDVVNEIENYTWITDSLGKPTEQPLMKDDHAMDAVRYVTVFLHEKAKDATNNERVGFFVNRSRRK